MNVSILRMLADHWPAVREIYAEGIATGNATFETAVPDWEEWDAGHRKDCRLIAVAPTPSSEGSGVLGWAALGPVSSRQVYRGVAEVSVYVAGTARRHGVGRALLEALIEQSEARGVWTLQAAIFPENVASLALHRRCGFREVGIRRKIGKLGERWRDTALLERRSERSGM
jgi:L-amino acid N-acyltransferase YncA